MNIYFFLLENDMPNYTHTSHLALSHNSWLKIRLKQRQHDINIECIKFIDSEARL